MGNAWFGKNSKRSTKAVVHPVPVVQGVSVTIKVRMTRAQFKDLTEKVDMTNANSELGTLIAQECSKGRFHARLVVAASAGDYSERANMYSKGRALTPIQENSDE